MRRVRCWWSGAIDMPGTSSNGWRCKANAVRAVKVKPDGLKAWTDQAVPIEYVPLCGEHVKEVEGRVDDWLDIAEYAERAG